MDTSRVSACSYPLQKRDLDTTFKVISEAGFQKIDLLARMPHFSVSDPDYSLDELRRVSELYGVRVANIGSYCGRGFAAESDSERQEEMAEFRKTLDVARTFGSRSIRVAAGSGERESLDLLVPYFQEVAPYAEELGITIGD